MESDARGCNLVWSDCDRYRASLFLGRNRFSKQKSTLLHPDVSPVPANWSAIATLPQAQQLRRILKDRFHSDPTMSPFPKLCST